MDPATGYTLRRNTAKIMKIFSVSTRSWSNQRPSCVRMRCAVPHIDPSNGLVTCDSESYVGSKCRSVTCEVAVNHLSDVMCQSGSNAWVDMPSRGRRCQNASSILHQVNTGSGRRERPFVWVSDDWTEVEACCFNRDYRRSWRCRRRLVVMTTALWPILELGQCFPIQSLALTSRLA